MKNILAIETSCDDTSVAIVNSKAEVILCLTASQDLVHEPFGGIVPEIASRNHTKHLLPLVEKAMDTSGLSWKDISGIAVTNRPGLVGSLIVGLVTAKTLALAYEIPFIGVHHIEGHIMAPFLRDDEYKGPDFFKDPFLALVVSGGHTQLYEVNGFGHYQVLGQTMDDAAGEAFDKFAKMMGLGYPGGVQVDRLAKSGNIKAFSFPRPLLNEDHFNFSFSGLKSAAQRQLEKLPQDKDEPLVADLCASYQQAIVDVLCGKLVKASFDKGIKNVIVSGGVSANSSLRNHLQAEAEKNGWQLAIPPLRFCTDNAAMIALAGHFRLQQGDQSSQELAPQARAEL
ncbi:MAG: tRNA (adenosine(37)-N6)-threonylcarbamoyltransferase complex transferase subunit TsaD [Bdellovibrionales bacterium]|nr:tRNA (adenosine(37)-N6)-threonylcarbamoyltransferase complex transferase subunit TsaD [Bdellovibrionales bacterium]